MTYLLKSLSRNGRTEYVDIKNSWRGGVRICIYCAHISSYCYGQTVCLHYGEDVDIPFVRTIVTMRTNRLTVLWWGCGQTVWPYYGEDADKPFDRTMARMRTNRLTVLWWGCGQTVWLYYGEDADIPFDRTMVRMRTYRLTVLWWGRGRTVCLLVRKKNVPWVLYWRKTVSKHIKNFWNNER